MRSIVLTRSATAGDSGIGILDTYISPFNVGIGIVVSGTVDYTVQHTFQNPNDSTVTATWFNHPSLAALTANADGNYAFPVAAVKIVLNSGDGTVTGTFNQAGMPGRG